MHNCEKCTINLKFGTINLKLKIKLYLISEIKWANLIFSSRCLFFVTSTLGKNNQSLIWIIILYFIVFELLMNNRYSNFYSSFMIFWRMTIPLDRPSIYFPPLFCSPLNFRDRVVSLLWFRSSSLKRRAGSIPVQLRSFWALVSSI